MNKIKFNYRKGIRQIKFVTSEKDLSFQVLIKFDNDYKMITGTVYQKHRTLQISKLNSCIKSDTCPVDYSVLNLLFQFLTN